MAKLRKIKAVNLNDTSTWLRYKKGLCDDCMGSCCTLAVEVNSNDLIRMQLISEFEAEHESPKNIAKALMKQGIIEHFNFKSSMFTLTRHSNNDCLYLDRKTRRCTIYTKRPTTCRKHPQIGPKADYCAYIQRK